MAVGPMGPVEQGLVASLARPGGKYAQGEHAKQLEFLHDMVPGLARTVMLVAATSPGDVLSWEEYRGAAEAAGVQAERVDVQSVGDLEGVFELPALGRAQALILAGAGTTFQPVRGRLAELALQRHLPGIAKYDYAEVGLLMNYGANTPALFRRAGVYVDKILKGTKPADLPVQLPTAFDFALNVKTAQALGLTIPPDVAAQVTQWVQ